MDANDHIFDLIPAYALGCLDQEEATQAGLHLPNCLVCQEELHAYESSISELPSVIPQRSPPEALRVRLLESVRSSFEEENLFVREAALSPGNSGKSAHLLAFWQWLLSWRAPALAGVGLILILAFSNILLWQQVNTLRGEITDTDMLVHSLYPANAEPISTGLVVMDPHGDFGTVIVDSLKPSSESQYYQVWLGHEGEIDSGGMLTVHENGYGAKVIYAPFPLHTYTRIWVTIEPEEDSEQPTGTVVLQTTP
jgi:hypothetical protein